MLNSMTIDVHVHFVPAQQLDALEHTGVGVVGNDGDARTLEIGHHTHRFGPAFTSVDAVLASMDRRGVTESVLSVVPPTYGYRFSPRVTESIARAANEGLAAAAALAQPRVRWFATVPFNDVPVAIDVLREAMAAGAAGASIGTNVAGANLDDPSLADFFAAAADRQAPLLIHAEDVLASDRMSRHYLTNLVGNPYEAGLAVASLIFGGVVERFPALRVCICHAGGTTSSIVGRWDHAWRANRLAGTVLASAPSTYLGRMWFDTLAHNDETLRSLSELAGVDRLVYGSDAPFPMGDLRPVSWLDELPWLTGGQREAVRATNAGRFLNGS